MIGIVIHNYNSRNLNNIGTIKITLLLLLLLLFKSQDGSDCDIKQWCALLKSLQEAYILIHFLYVTTKYCIRLSYLEYEVGSDKRTLGYCKLIIL